VQEPPIGAEGVVRRVVSEEMSADAMGNEGLHVLATPALALLFEHSAIEAIAKYLDDGELTVGTELLVRHLAPTPVGMNVTVAARLVGVRERMLDFTIDASDAAGAIGEGSHTRAILDRERFDRTVERRRG
jgi:predicted thioesterase